jgi:hypothetical protein
MNKVKFFHEETQIRLEYTVNDFIRDKDIINVSYSINDNSNGYRHVCCVLYKE